MNGKKCMVVVLSVIMLLNLSACGDSGTAVFVQSVAELAGLGGIAPDDRFAGIVVSENVAEVNRDSDKTIKELLVKAGDDVKKDQVLFSYDTEQLQLTLDKQRLEKEQLEASIENYQRQIADLEKQRKKVKESAQLQYTVQIQSLQVDLKEAELNLQAKEREITKSEDVLDNAEVKSPVDGRVQVINESGTDNQGRPAPYITIQQSGAYRVKGTLGELQRGGIMEGDRVTMVSRIDEKETWSGTVTLVDYENPSQGSDMDRYYGMSTDEMSASSKYPFYVELDSTEGLLLGQHLYIKLETEAAQSAGIPIGSAFICYGEDGSAFVWAEQKGKLEKRTVTLGEYNPMTDAQEILSGITLEDYLAFPDELCREGVPTTRERPAAAETEPAEGGVD